MADSRRTRKRKFHVAHRQTRRVVVQRGGAEWPKIPDDFADALSAQFPTLKRLKETAATATNADITNEQIMEDYIKCLERQDELFETALNIIRTKVSTELTLDLTNPGIIIANAAAIDAKKADTIKYINAAERLISFKVDEISRELGATKLQEVLGDKVPLSLLLLFPKKLNNLLVEALANIFVALRENKASLLSNPAAATILASQYEGYAQSLAYTLTAKPLRDGFFLNQSIIDFKNELDTDYSLAAALARSLTKRGASDKFWITFVTALFTNKDVTDVTNLFKHDNKADTGCSHRMREGTSTWGKIAADVFKFHDIKPNGDILELFTEKCVIGPQLDDDTFEYIPNRELLDVAVRGTSLGKLMSNMEDTTLQFILQLSYSIKKAIKTDAVEKAASST